MAASGTGNAVGGVAASGMGTSSATGLGWFTPAVAVSGTGCATSSEVWGSSAIAVSGTGCSTAEVSEYWGGNGIAVSGTGDASGRDAAVSGGGNAGQYGTCRFETAPVFGPDLPIGPSVSVLGNASGCTPVSP